MYDTVKAFCSCAIEWIQALVASHYCFGDPKDHYAWVAELIEQDNFALMEIIDALQIRSVNVYCLY